MRRDLITTNGVERYVEAPRLARLVELGAVYRCDDLSCVREDAVIWHVDPTLELEEAYERGLDELEAEGRRTA